MTNFTAAVGHEEYPVQAENQVNAALKIVGSVVVRAPFQIRSDKDFWTFTRTGRIHVPKWAKWEPCARMAARARGALKNGRFKR